MVGECHGVFERKDGEFMKRRRMSSRGSKKHFTKHAVKTHKRNVPTRLPMRGGIRL